MAPKKKGENRRRGQDGVKTGSVPAIGKWQNILSEKEQFSRERTHRTQRNNAFTHPPLGWADRISFRPFRRSNCCFQVYCG